MPKTHMRLHLGPEWHIFHALTSEGIHDSHVLLLHSLKWQVPACLYDKKKINTWRIENFIFSW